MSCENHLRILFTPYPIRSISESPYLELFYSGVKVRFSGLGFYRLEYESSPLYPIAIAAMT